MARRIPSKPRYKISYSGRSKIWFTKDSRLRRFFSIRGRQLIRRRRLFTRNVLVANKIKWIIARRSIRPVTRSKTVRSRRITYRDNFYAKQQFRAFFGKVEEHVFRQYFKNNQISSIKRQHSFFIKLESRLDVRRYRRRLLPTIFACNQFIRTHGLVVGGQVNFEPDYSVPLNTVISVSIKHWNVIYDHVITRIFYRVYGKWLLKKRQRRLFLKKFRWLSRTRRRTRPVYFPLRRWLTVRKTLERLRNDRLKRLRNWRKLVLQTYVIEPQKIVKFLHRLKVIENNRGRIINYARGQGRSIFKNTKKKSWLRRKGTSLRNSYANNTKAYLLSLNIYQRRLAFIRLFAVAEHYFYEEILLLESKNNKRYSPTILHELKLLLEQRRVLVDSRFAKDFRRRKLQASLFLRSRDPVKLKYSKIQQKKTDRRFRRSSVAFFLRQQRRKIRRQRRVPRLKRIHWYIPSYIHIDIRTLQAVFVRVPKVTELHYPFQCSVSKILAFYKSRGY